MNEPEWDAFLASVLGIDLSKQKQFVPEQQLFFGPRHDFGGYPAKFFRTMAGGMLQELIAKCGNDKELVAVNAGMSVKNLYPILNGKNDPKLGTLLKLIHANGFYLSWKIAKLKSPKKVQP